MILKYGVQFHGILNCDMVWLTCCALYNYLLDVDGLDVQWDDGVLCDIKDGNNTKDVPYAIRKMLNPIGATDIDFSGIGPGNDCKADSDCPSDNEVVEETMDAVRYPDGSRNVTDLSFSYFREKLIIHFNIMFKENKIKWPTGNKIDNETIICI